MGRLLHDGLLEKESVYEGVKSEMGESLKVGSMGMYETLEPDQERVFEFIISWFFPNRIKAWDTDSCCCAAGGCETVKNYYATLFDDAWHAGRYLLENLDRLEGKSRDFHRALFGSTLPDYVIDAIASNITVCRSTTCFRIEDGTFLGWEGTFDQRRLLRRKLYPRMELCPDPRLPVPGSGAVHEKVEFNLETDENGKMSFRTRRVFGKEPWDFLPATDGQMGTIRLYREWKISGDDELIKTVWEKASKALDFAFEYWDSDGDFVLDSQQHNTYDIEFYGPNSLTNSMFFAALKAGAEIADYLGDEQHAAKYREALEKGSKRMDELLWGGEYYIQMIDDVNKYRYQYGKGCLSDQILGQLLAHVAGLGYILPEEHVKEQ